MGVIILILWTTFLCMKKPFPPHPLSRFWVISTAIVLSWRAISDVLSLPASQYPYATISLYLLQSFITRPLSPFPIVLLALFTLRLTSLLLLIILVFHLICHCRLRCSTMDLRCLLPLLSHFTGGITALALLLTPANLLLSVILSLFMQLCFFSRCRYFYFFSCRSWLSPSCCFSGKSEFFLSSFTVF